MIGMRAKLGGSWSRLAAIFAASLALLAQPVLACGYHGNGIGDSFGAQHPKSLLVAFAVRDAVTAGTLPPSAIEPPKAGGSGYWRAVERLNRVSKAYSKNAGGMEASISILLVDSQLWARMTPGSQGYGLDVHTKGASEGDVLILTNDAVLAAIIDGRLSVTDALSLGALIVDGEAVAAEQVRAHLTATLQAGQSQGFPAPRPLPAFTRRQ